MAQPTDTQHKPSPNISGGANDIYLPENTKVSGGNNNIYLTNPAATSGGANDIYLADNTPTPNTGIYLENNKPV
tara:strand:+ start:1466 stop:1687 length:222 start_codon:yes stop_codon:yes gene_type:complete